MRLRRSVFGVIAAATGLYCVVPASGAILDFETPGQYDANFREVFTGGEMGQTSNGVANDFVTKLFPSGTANATVAILDSTPADGTVKTTFTGGFTVTFDFRAGDASSSIGIYAVDPTNETSGFLALFNIDDSGATPPGSDRIRIFSGSNPTTSAAGTAAATFTGTAGIDAGSAFTPVTVTYSVVGTTPTMSMNVGTLFGSQTFAPGTAIASPEIALRVFDATSGNANSTDVDNFNAVPEPGSAGLLGMGAIALLARRKSR